MSWAVVDWSAAVLLVTAGYVVGMVTGWHAGAARARRAPAPAGSRRARRRR